MTATDAFKKTIEVYLQQVAAEDPLFAEKFYNPNKNIDDCVTYILNWVQNSDRNGFTDEEVYGQAIHYYDEEEIEVGNPVNCRVVVNHQVELTPEEIQEAKEKAIQNAIHREEERIKAQRAKRTEERKPEVLLPSLFD